MFFSERYNLLIIGIPKTGSRAVEIAMSQFDPQGENHSITIGNKQYRGEHFPQGILGHARAREIKEVLGPEIFNKFHTVAFIRHPFSKLVSAYHFNKSDNLLGFLKIRGKTKGFKRKLYYFLTILIAKILPFKIWCLIYPYKPNLGYVMDKNGNRLVQYIGRTENLKEDLENIMHKIGLDVSNIDLQKINTSKHKEWQYYFRNKWFYKLIYKKVKADLEFYKTIEKELDNKNHTLIIE